MKDIDNKLNCQPMAYGFIDNNNKTNKACFFRDDPDLELAKTHENSTIIPLWGSFNFQYDELTEQYIAELDDKTVQIIAGGNRGKWAKELGDN